MGAPKRILILYYSQTRQTESALQAIADACRADGHSVDMARITPLTEFPFPWKRSVLLKLALKTYTGRDLTVPLHPLPPDVTSGTYDLVIIGHQPWFLIPSAPVNSFLDSDASRILAGRKVVSVITCRQHYRLSLRVFERKVRARGGTVVDSFVLTDLSREPFNMITSVYYLLTGREFHGGPFRKWFAPFGIGEPGLRRAGTYGRELSTRLTAGQL